MLPEEWNNYTSKASPEKSPPDSSEQSPQSDSEISNIITVYIVLFVLRKMRVRLGLEATLEYAGSYMEKMEYWALVWGTIIMTATGLFLWFDNYFVDRWSLPKGILDVALVIHYYEAWLATLAIAVFHFFFVIFHPEQYPMSFTWLTGEMTESEVKHHHPAWYEELQRADTGEVKSSDSSTTPTKAGTSDTKV